MNKHLRIILLIALASIASLVYAAPSSGGLDKITAYAGSWKGETENFATLYSKASKDTGTLHNDCWRSGEFYACHQIVNGKPAPVLTVYTYDAKADLYHVYGVPVSGDDPGAAGKLIIRGNVWTFPWEFTDKGKTVYFRVVNTWSSPRSIEYRQEFSADKVHWTLMAKGTEIKTRS